MEARLRLSCLLIPAAICMSSRDSLAAHRQEVSWVVQPFYTDSDYVGFRGHPALINPSNLILEGRRTRTVQNYGDGNSLIFDMKLDERLGDDGALWVFFIPTG